MKKGDYVSHVIWLENDSVSPQLIKVIKVLLIVWLGLAGSFFGIMISSFSYYKFSYFSREGFKGDFKLSVGCSHKMLSSWLINSSLIFES